MIIYNVTVKIEPESEELWINWMTDVHIPDVMNTGYFSHYQISRLLHQDDTDGITYVVQYHCPDITTLNTYFRDAAPALQTAHSKRFKDKYVAFRTIMQVLE